MSDPNPLTALSDSLAAATELVAKSVVTVNARRRFGASGIAWAEGLVVTADHVVEREEEITISLPDGGEQKATLAGRDPGSGIAVLKAPTAGLTIATRGGEPKVGHLVLAVGRPGAGGPMVSFGVISAVGGRWRTMRGTEMGGYIRSDTTLYPGFSGGPLVDGEGRVLGMNSSRMGRGAGLTIPTADVARVADQLQKQGRIRRGYLGIGSQPARLPEALKARLGGQESGLLVVGVEPGCPAESAGLLVGDILVNVAGRALTDTGDLQAVLGSDSVGQPLPATILRGGEPRDITITPAERQ